LTKVRIDKLLVERGLAPSRERAQALILAGKVLANEQKVEKAGAQVEGDAALRLLGEELRYVSRGGLKLEKALAHWGIDVRGRVCMDVGASTGGFTDCLLQHGAARVIAIDTGYGQMDLRLRADPRVRLLEKTNARYLRPEDVAEPVDFIAMDVSFISAALVLPAVLSACGWIPAEGQIRVSGYDVNLPDRGNDSAEEQTRVSGHDFSRAESSPPTGRGFSPRELVVLVKPQFEAGREKVGKGGIVRDPEVQAAAVEKVRRAVVELGAVQTDVIESPILGAEGNREFLLYARFQA
jgi:23S rRNA (cytidine1920-2'-O)/16S rRNA (cytidine1409-2'-O)-methyltransferase